MTVMYVSRLMKGYEVRQACAQFREQDSRLRKLQIKIFNTKKRPEATGQ